MQEISNPLSMSHDEISVFAFSLLLHVFVFEKKDFSSLPPFYPILFTAAAAPRRVISSLSFVIVIDGTGR